MSGEALPRVRTASTRVALIATGIVAGVYLAIAVVVVLIVSANLTSQVDRRLSNSLLRLTNGTQRFNRQPFPDAPDAPRFGPPLLVWTVRAGGQVTGNNVSATLPIGDRNVAAPQTITVGDTDVRVTGRSMGNDHIIVGQTMAGVVSARENLILAEVVVGPILLATVFLGALTIGRHVAAPIDLARQRQMEFTADASHELRTPLSVIEAQASLALERTRDASWYRTAFERVDRESKRIRHLVEDLLWLARFDATSGRPSSEYVDAGVLVQQTVDRFQTIAEARGLTVVARTTDQSLIVSIPPDWLDRLLGVLLDNACKYSPPDGRVEVSASLQGGRIRLSVEDAGPGIPVEERQRIFDRFHRATDGPAGAGLGLAIADAVVQATDGQWDLSNSSLGGISMSVLWQRTLIPTQPASAQSVAPDHRPADGPRMEGTAHGEPPPGERAVDSR